MELTFIEKILLKGALKEDRFSVKISVLIIEILLISLSITFIYFYITKKHIILFNDAVLLAFLALFVFIIRSYQSLIRKTKKDKNNK